MSTLVIKRIVFPMFILCTASMVMEYLIDEWNRKIIEASKHDSYYLPLVTQEESESFNRLLERAKKYDEETGQPDCALEEKKEILKKLALQLGVDLKSL